MSKHRTNGNGGPAGSAVCPDQLDQMLLEFRRVPSALPALVTPWGPRRADRGKRRSPLALHEAGPLGERPHEETQ